MGMCGEGTGAAASVHAPHLESSRLLEGQPSPPEPSQLLRGARDALAPLFNDKQHSSPSFNYETDAYPSATV